MPSVLEVFVSGDWPAGRLGHIRTRREAEGRRAARPHQAQRLGVDIAVDDFGTGYSSLSHLRLPPIDDLKTDQSFVRGVATSRRDRHLVTAIVQMARALELRTIAEEVETAAQAAALLALGCRIGQGCLFATPAPAPAPAVLAYLRTRQRHARLALVETTAEIPTSRSERR